MIFDNKSDTIPISTTAFQKIYFFELEYKKSIAVESLIVWKM